MKIGFTGTRRGMTPEQQDWVRRELERLRPEEVHHGDCIGADAGFHEIVRALPFPVNIVIHPPLDNKRAAYKSGDAYREPKGYLDRDLDIVEETEMLFATPAQMSEIRRSGTWATVRRVRKLDRPVTIFYPNGRREYEKTVGYIYF